MTEDDVYRLADKLTRCVEMRDIETLRREIYSPDCTVWHNEDGREQSAAENLAFLASMRDRLSVWRYERVQRHLTTEGYVQQHVVRLEDRDGNTVHMPACLVVRVRDGKIVRIEEYCDSSPTRALSV